MTEQYLKRAVLVFKSQAILPNLWLADKKQRGTKIQVLNYVNFNISLWIVYTSVPKPQQKCMLATLLPTAYLFHL